MPKMKAVQVPKPGADFEIVERDVPEPGPRQVRIRVQACGVCHSDAVTKEGLFPGISYPRVPGHEIAGVIDEIGAGVSRTFEPVPIGEKVSYRIPLVPNARRFRAGHKLRLYLTSDDQDSNRPAMFEFRHASIGTSSFNTVFPHLGCFCLNCTDPDLRYTVEETESRLEVLANGWI